MSKHWPRKPLRQVADVLMGQSPPGSSYNSDGYGDALLNGPTEFGERYPKAVQWTTAGTRFCEKGDILFCVRGSTTGRMNWADRRYCIGRGLAAIRAKPDECNTAYLSMALTHLAAEVIHQADDGVFPNLDRDRLLDFEMPVPKPAEQRRLVARIESLTSRLEQARQARQAALAEAESAQAALVDAVFAKRDGDWDEATVKQLCGQPQYGYTESASHEEVGPHFLRITDIQDGKVNWQTVPFCQCDEPAKYRLADGDIVFARTGATTGKSYLVHNPPEAVFASYLIRIRPGERVLPEYVWWYFQSSGYWHSVFSGIDDGNRPNMNGSKLAALRIPFPKGKAEQRRIVSRLDTLAAKQAELRRLQTETEAELAAFTPALLARAFRGEL